MKILVINGPNMQLLGRRKAEFYGTKTLPEIEADLRAAADSLGVTVDFFQSNHEGAICDRIADAITGGVDGIVINPAAYTHTSIAILDALKAVALPAVEVHLSDVSVRESFRRVSYAGLACRKTFMGLGFEGYRRAILFLRDAIEGPPRNADSPDTAEG